MSQPATPLTRYGSRISTFAPTARSAPAPRVPAASASSTTPASIRRMIVCLPDELPDGCLTTHRLDRHLGVSGTLASVFWASPALHPWQRGRMFGLRKGRPAACAGGPLRLLDLAGTRHAASVGAGIRHQLFTRVVAGTRPATPWWELLARHLADPDRYPRSIAEADFQAQPRVQALRMHNAAVTYGAGRLDLDDLEVLQAGQATYQNHAAVTALVGDTMLTVEGGQLAPAGDALTHRITYLAQAHRHLDTVEPDQRLIAVAL